MNFNELMQKMRDLDAPVSEELKGNQDQLDELSPQLMKRAVKKADTMMNKNYYDDNHNATYDYANQGSRIQHGIDKRAGKPSEYKKADAYIKSEPGANTAKGHRMPVGMEKGDEDVVDECGMMPSPMSSPGQQDSISANISMNASGAGGIRDLMAILHNIENGSSAHSGDEHDMAVAIDTMDEPEPLLGMDEAEGGGFDHASTTPNPQIAPLGAAFPKGNDISSHGNNERPKVNGGGNPYSVTAESLIPRLSSLYQEVKSR